MSDWWLYVIRCADGSLYTGITTDVQRRFVQHETGSGARYVRGRGPLALVATCKTSGRSRASQLELRFKSQTKKQKEAWLLRDDGLRRFCDQCESETLVS
ncbi:MAG: GIY-YIG nuclease family protein [Pseudomonadota bacterium]